MIMGQLILMILIIILLKIMSCYFSPSNQPNVVAQILGVKPFFVKEYMNGKKNYTKRQIFNIIGYLSDYDLKSKGYGNSSTSDGELLKELVFKILHWRIFNGLN